MTADVSDSPWRSERADRPARPRTAPPRVIEKSEKHGFCVEDNTGYRDLLSSGTNGAPASPVYSCSQSCGQGQPQATSIVHGMSIKNESNNSASAKIRVSGDAVSLLSATDGL